MSELLWSRVKERADLQLLLYSLVKQTAKCAQSTSLASCKFALKPGASYCSKNVGHSAMGGNLEAFPTTRTEHECARHVSMFCYTAANRTTRTFVWRRPSCHICPCDGSFFAPRLCCLLGSACDAYTWFAPGHVYGDKRMPFRCMYAAAGEAGNHRDRGHIVHCVPSLTASYVGMQVRNGSTLSCGRSCQVL